MIHPFPYDEVKKSVFAYLKPTVTNYVEKCFENFQNPDVEKFILEKYGYSLEEYVEKIIENEKTNFDNRINEAIIELEELEEEKIEESFHTKYYKFDKDANFYVNVPSLTFFWEPDNFTFRTLTDASLVNFNNYFDIDQIIYKGGKVTLIMMMDISGSMGQWEKIIAKSTFGWIEAILKKIYDTVEVHFIGLSSIAEILTREEMFIKNAGGGTIASLSFNEMLKIANNEHNTSDIIPIYFSDGDNLSSDVVKVISKLNDIIQITNNFHYFETNQYNRHSTLMSSFKYANIKFFHYNIVQRSSQIKEIVIDFMQKNETIMDQIILKSLD